MLPIVTLNSINLFGLTYEFVLERIEKARVRATFERYVSRNVVREILDSREEYENLLGGHRKAVTILFSDIRGFTTMTESADSSALVVRLTIPQRHGEVCLQHGRHPWTNSSATR